MAAAVASGSAGTVDQTRGAKSNRVIWNEPHDGMNRNAPGQNRAVDQLRKMGYAVTLDPLPIAG